MSPGHITGQDRTTEDTGQLNRNRHNRKLFQICKRTLRAVKEVSENSGKLMRIKDFLSLLKKNTTNHQKNCNPGTI